MSRKIDKYTEKEVLYLNAKEIIGAISFFILIEILFIIVSISLFYSITHQIISILVFSIILFIAILSILTYKPNLLFLRSNERWKGRRKERLFKQIAYCKKELRFIDVDPDEDFNDELSELNKIIIQQNTDIKEFKSIISLKQKEIETASSQILALQNELDAKQIELNKSLDDQKSLNQEMKKVLSESPNNNMKIFIKSLICIFLGYKYAQKPRSIIAYDKKNGHGFSGILQKKFDLYKSKKDEPPIQGLVCPITGDTLENWLKDIDIITENK